MDASQLDWLTGWQPLTAPFEERLPESFFAGLEPVPVFLDDEERYGEPEERVDPQTGYLQECR